MKRRRRALLKLQKLKELPPSLNKGAVDRALESFIRDSHVLTDGVDAVGVLQQLRDNVAASILFKNSPESFVWAAEENGEVAAWAMTQKRLGIDNTQCYWMTNAWVAKHHRRQPYVKDWFQALKDDAKAQGCAHILIPSSRNSKAYCRFLGGGFHEYLTILKEDI